MTAQEALQARIDAQQDYDALVYGLRNLGSLRSEVTVAYQVAERLFGHYVQRDLSGRQLKDAKRLAAERVNEAKAAEREFGTRRQLRLALATADEAELAVAA